MGKYSSRLNVLFIENQAIVIILIYSNVNLVEINAITFSLLKPRSIPLILYQLENMLGTTGIKEQGNPMPHMACA